MKRRRFFGWIAAFGVALHGWRVRRKAAMPVSPSVIVQGENPADVIRDILTSWNIPVDDTSFDEAARHYAECGIGSVPESTGFETGGEYITALLQELHDPDHDALIVDRGVYRLGRSDFPARIYDQTPVA